MVKNQRGVIHFVLLIILLLGIIAGVYLVQKTQIFRPKAYQTNTAITDLTNQLINKSEQYAKADENSKDESLQSMIATASRRKDILLQEIKSDPQAFLDNATLADRSNEFPQEVQQYIEKNIQASGAILTLHGDNFEQRKSDISYDLLTDDQQYALYFAKNAPKPVTGLDTHVTGIGFDNNIVLGSGEFIDSETQYKWTGQDFKEINIGVFLISMTDMKPEEIADLAQDPDIIRDALFADTGSVKDYFLKSSYNKLLVKGDILGSYTLTDNTDTCTNDKLLSWSKSVEKQIPEDTLNQYDSLIYVLPDIESCNFWGLTTLGNLGSKTVKNNVDLSKLRAWITFPHYQTLSYIHELGHNLGVHHANGLDCGDQPISNSCESKEYLDAFDVMGSSGRSPLLTPLDMNVPHKIALNWLTSQNVQTITESGTYQIKPLGKLSTPNDIVGLKIYRPQSRDYYFLEYRQRLGYDTKLPDIVTRGALLHIWNGDPGTQTQLVHINAGLIEITVHPAFFDDKVFKDSYNGIRIQQISHDQNGVTLNIQI